MSFLNAGFFVMRVIILSYTTVCITKTLFIFSSLYFLTLLGVKISSNFNT